MSYLRASFDLTFIKMTKIISINDSRYERIFIDSEHYFIFRDAPRAESGVYFGVLPTYDSRDRTIEIRRVRDSGICNDVISVLQKLAECEEEI